MKKYTIIIYECGEVKETHTDKLNEAINLASVHNEKSIFETAEIFDNQFGKFVTPKQ